MLTLLWVLPDRWSNSNFLHSLLKFHAWKTFTLKALKLCLNSGKIVKDPERRRLKILSPVPKHRLPQNPIWHFHPSKIPHDWGSTPLQKSYFMNLILSLPYLLCLALLVIIMNKITGVESWYTTFVANFTGLPAIAFQKYVQSIAILKVTVEKCDYYEF